MSGDSMVEKVAAALFDRQHNGKFSHAVTMALFGKKRITYAEVAKGVEDGVYVESCLSKVRADARAAISAMREPTEEMIDEGGCSLPDYNPGNADAAECWTRMIDAALSHPGLSAGPIPGSAATVERR